MPFEAGDGYQHLYLKHYNVAVYDGNLGVGSGQFNVGSGHFNVQNSGQTTINNYSQNDALTINNYSDREQRYYRDEPELYINQDYGHNLLSTARQWY